MAEIYPVPQPSAPAIPGLEDWLPQYDETLTCELDEYMQFEFEELQFFYDSFNEYMGFKYTLQSAFMYITQE